MEMSHLGLSVQGFSLFACVQLCVSVCVSSRIPKEEEVSLMMAVLCTFHWWRRQRIGFLDMT